MPSFTLKFDILGCLRDVFQQIPLQSAMGQPLTLSMLRLLSSKTQKLKEI